MPSRETIPPDRYWYTFGPHAPALRVAPGTSLRVSCPDSDNLTAAGTALPASAVQEAIGTSLFRGNPLAGPVAVEGACPGDLVLVRIDNIVLDRALGRTLLDHGHGVVPSQFLSPRTEINEAKSARDPTLHLVPTRMYEWNIDAPAGVARLVNALGPDPIAVKLRPFVGCIGVCPEFGQSIASLSCGTFGGNMDLPLTAAGYTIALPVFRDGGLVFLGDVHAAQGHGEFIGGGIETSGTIDFTIGLMKGAAPADAVIRAPRMWNAESLGAVGLDGDVRGAAQRACAHLMDWLSEEGMSMNRWDAYNLVSQCGSLVVGNLMSPPYPVAMTIRRDELPARVNDAFTARYDSAF